MQVDNRERFVIVRLSCFIFLYVQYSTCFCLIYSRKKSFSFGFFEWFVLYDAFYFL